MLPTNELARFNSAKEFDIVWPTWHENKEPTERIMREAMKTFNVANIALSFFDDKSEIFKAASWYKEDRMPRNASLAGHALLSCDIFVVLDAAKVNTSIFFRIFPINDSRTGDSPITASLKNLPRYDSSLLHR